MGILAARASRTGQQPPSIRGRGNAWSSGPRGPASAVPSAATSPVPPDGWRSCGVGRSLIVPVAIRGAVRFDAARHICHTTRTERLADRLPRFHGRRLARRPLVLCLCCGASVPCKARVTTYASLPRYCFCMCYASERGRSEENGRRALTFRGSRDIMYVSDYVIVTSKDGLTCQR